MFEDMFECDIDGTVTLEVLDNGDGEHVIVNLTHDDGTAIGIGLTPEKAEALAEALQTLAAGI